MSVHTLVSTSMDAFYCARAWFQCPWIQVCLHVVPSSLCSSKSPSKLNIVSMMTDTLTDRMGCTPILSGKLSIKISKMPLTKTMTFTVHVNKAYYWNRRGFQIGLKVHTCTLLTYNVIVHTYECTDIHVGCTVQCTCVLYITITRCVNPL